MPPPTPVDKASENVPTTSALRFTACIAPESAPKTTAQLDGEGNLRHGDGTRRAGMATTCGRAPGAARAAASAAPESGPPRLVRGAGGLAYCPQELLLHVLAWLAKQPFILLFLVVAAGYALGRVKIKGIGLGATASSLVIALGVSLLARGARREDRRPRAGEHDLLQPLHVLGGHEGRPAVPVRAQARRRQVHLLRPVHPARWRPGSCSRMRALVPLAPGLLPGILAGSNTATPGLGAAQAAYAAPHGARTTPETLANLSTAFAFSYCISTVLFVVLMKLPDMLGRDTRARGARVRGESAAGRRRRRCRARPTSSWAARCRSRGAAYQIEKPEPVGHRLGELRRTYPLVAIERVLRGGQLLEPVDEVVLQPHDTLALYGRVPRLLSAAVGHRARGGRRPSWATSGRRPSTSSRTRRDGRRPHDCSTSRATSGHGLYLNAMFRGGDADPVGPGHRRPARRRPARHGQPVARSRRLEAHVGQGRPPQRQHRPRDAGAGRRRGQRCSAP